jgi:hypothetical protein
MSTPEEELIAQLNDQPWEVALSSRAVRALQVRVSAIK